MREELIELLSEIRPEIDFEKESNFIENGLFDSLDLATIISEICERFDVDIGFDELKQENFDSLEAMMKLIEKYK